MRGFALFLMVAAWWLARSPFGKAFGEELGRAAAAKLAEDPSAFARAPTRPGSTAGDDSRGVLPPAVEASIAWMRAGIR